MADNFIKIFRDKVKLEQLKEKLRGDYTYASIGRFFGIDRTTVQYQAKKLGLEKKRQFRIYDLFPVPTEKPVVEVKVNKPDLRHPLAKEKMNPGLPTYRDYVKAEEERRIQNLLNKATPR